MRWKYTKILFILHFGGNSVIMIFGALLLLTKTIKIEILSNNELFGLFILLFMIQYIAFVCDRYKEMKTKNEEKPR